MPSKELKQVIDHMPVVEIDRRVEAGGEALAGALSALGASIDGMSPDDVILEIHSERVGNKASSHIRLRAYRHKD